ncbi:MAG: TetR/AcrR family transcriptional regulator [Alphaproteobacteria bacterium]|nr:TetR/AcrR family transcriptional regulator [Alphaproteobacteria bacterium]MCW5744125.1 TetR/AcrR family transcriptional regulator [Alphaproteobacteria bacterium]
MTRPYTLGKRADQQARTRRRIVEAAVELHTAIGPAATSFSMVAERAGVQRHTLYAHFPDERSLLLACSAHAIAGDPTPDAEAWRAIASSRERLMAGLTTIYSWYERNAQLMASVLRDAEHHAPTRETMELRYGPSVAAWHDVLGARLRARQRALLHLALGYHAWRALVVEGGLKPAAAVRLMVQAIERAEEG